MFCNYRIDVSYKVNASENPYTKKRQIMRHMDQKFSFIYPIIRLNKIFVMYLTICITY